MAQNWHDAPEVATHTSYPEVYYPTPTPEVARTHYQENYAQAIPLKQFSDTSTFIETPKHSYPVASPIQTNDNHSVQGILPPIERPRESSRRVFGCPLIVFILSVSIGILSIIVIGLAAGTGIQGSRANDAESKLASLMANISNIDRGCSANPSVVTATTYTSYYFGKPTYKIYCNNDAPNPPLQSLFVGNFDDCMDACTAYSAYTAGNFPDETSSANFTCSAVSFIPAWTNRTFAVEQNAPGNCYLKPGPQNTTALKTSQPGAVHAALLQT
ncbi:hypothetical protein F5Y19DRAFT_432259 [Xylariaceae sp. FL1651]|nr:hypothetical protein F5Y19DRAFT_432259 [Xylariaceae sp. FL1651]